MVPRLDQVLAAIRFENAFIDVERHSQQALAASVHALALELDEMLRVLGRRGRRFASVRVPACGAEGESLLDRRLTRFSGSTAVLLGPRAFQHHESFRFGSGGAGRNGGRARNAFAITLLPSESTDSRDPAATLSQWSSQSVTQSSMEPTESAA